MTLLYIERAHDEITLYGDEYIAYAEPLSAIISSKDELSIAFQTSQQTAFIALIGNAVTFCYHNHHRVIVLIIFVYSHSVYRGLLEDNEITTHDDDSIIDATLCVEVLR